MTCTSIVAFGSEAKTLLDQLLIVRGKFGGESRLEKSLLTSAEFRGLRGRFMSARTSNEENRRKEKERHSH